MPLRANAHQTVVFHQLHEMDHLHFVLEGRSTARLRLESSLNVHSKAFAIILASTVCSAVYWSLDILRVFIFERDSSLAGIMATSCSLDKTSLSLVQLFYLRHNFCHYLFIHSVYVVVVLIESIQVAGCFCLSKIDQIEAPMSKKRAVDIMLCFDGLGIQNFKL